MSTAKVNFYNAVPDEKLTYPMIQPFLWERIAEMPKII